MKTEDEFKKLLSDITVTENYVKFIRAGYTDREIRLYHRALQERDEVMLSSISCKCYDGFFCPVCHLKKLRDQMDEKYKGTI